MNSQSAHPRGPPPGYVPLEDMTFETRDHFDQQDAPLAYDDTKPPPEYTVFPDTRLSQIGVQEWLLQCVSAVGHVSVVIQVMIDHRDRTSMFVHECHYY